MFIEGEPPRLSKKEEEKATIYGGSEYVDYDSYDLLPSCDKGGHKERSIHDSPVHLDHWKKVEKEESHRKG